MLQCKVFFFIPFSVVHMNSLISSAKNSYFEHVWKYVRQVPYGKVVTYGQIAQSIPQPLTPDLDGETNSISQLVGSAMAACPDDVPWHRVINALGKVSSRADAARQQMLLEAEGLVFYEGRLRLEESQWHGNNSADKPKQHDLF